MTEAVVSARRTRPGPARPGTLLGPACRDALHAEWTKLRTLASTWWLLLAAAALTVAVGAAVAATYQCSGGPAAALRR